MYLCTTEVQLLKNAIEFNDWRSVKTVARIASENGATIMAKHGHKGAWHSIGLNVTHANVHAVESLGNLTIADARQISESLIAAGISVIEA